MKCPNEHEGLVGAKFCQVCGEKIEEKKCECGALDFGYQYCYECGKKHELGL